MKEKAVNRAIKDIYEELRKEILLGNLKKGEVIRKKHLLTEETILLNKELGIE